MNSTELKTTKINLLKPLAGKTEKLPTLFLKATKNPNFSLFQKLKIFQQTKKFQATIQTLSISLEKRQKQLKFLKKVGIFKKNHAKMHDFFNF